MFHIGIDYHKRYSYVTVVNDKGQIQLNTKIGNTKEAFEQLISGFNDKCDAVVETTYNWGIPYDIVKELGIEIKLAHAVKLRAIAESKIKTDQRDSFILAELLRSNLIPEVHVPPKDIREIKNIMRQRLFLVKIRTKMKNRTHQIIDRNHICTSEFSDLFGVSGRKFINSLSLGETDNNLLKENMELLDIVISQIKQIDKWLNKYLKADENLNLLLTIPGIGKILGSLIVLETFDINRFNNSKKYASYCGLVPRTYASGGHIYSGRLIPGGNKYLKWAFVEAAWKSIVSSPYCKILFNRIKRHKGANIAVVALARKLSEITYKVLKEKREYIEYMHKENDRS